MLFDIRSFAYHKSRKIKYIFLKIINSLLSLSVFNFILSKKLLTKIYVSKINRLLIEIYAIFNGIIINYQ